MQGFRGNGRNVADMQRRRQTRMDIERSMQRAKSLLVPWPGIWELGAWSLELALGVRGRYCLCAVEKMRGSLLPIAPQQRGLQDTPWIVRVLILCALLRSMPNSKSKILCATDKLVPHITGSIFFQGQAKELLLCTMPT